MNDAVALELGRRWAQTLGADVGALVIAVGATIEERSGGISPARVLIAESHPGTRRIVLFSDAMAYVAETDGGDVRSLALAHECFHLLEGGGESAAHAFARGFLGL
ncbi:MAG: hypothetical protein JO101_06855 [Candidatus Eremiobacteraeota bacterium]|nr:hypothetical protein [Candidatus Eremiobacteraeota bacterium]MBV8355022.1 hypothetical protein [Candidatus Eremiobacteraeota bacterium]